MKAAARFTRENPCTKVELHNAFWRDGGYRDTPVVQAKMVCGDNSVKYMAREGFIIPTTQGTIDMYVVTPKGRAWLAEGLARYLELHPERRAECIGMGASRAPVRRRTHLASTPAAPPGAPAGRVIRRGRV